MTATNGVPRKGGFAGFMIGAAWVLLIGILTAYFSGWLDRRDNPNQLVAGATSADGVREVFLKQNRWGHYVVTGKINGHPVKFLLDTGATDVSVPAPVAKDLELRAGHSQIVNTANGSITTFFTQLDQVNLGTIQLSNVQAHINPHMDSDEVLRGMSFLRHLELFQRDRGLTLRQYPVR